MNVADEDKVSVIAISKRAKKAHHTENADDIEVDGKEELSEEDLDD